MTEHMKVVARTAIVKRKPSLVMVKIFLLKVLERIYKAKSIAKSIISRQREIQPKASLPT